jgi:two-component sensor histidine kinase
VWADAARVATSERSSTGFFTLILIWFVGAVGAAAALSVLLSRSIANAARVAEALDTGKNAPAAGSFITEIDEVLKSLVAATCERLRKEEELRMLLRETAHRAKNQIAITTSLLGLSARRATSVPGLKDDLTKRLAALGRSIDMMGGSRVETAPLADLIEVQLTPFLNEQPGLLELDGAPTTISQSAAQSFGLVLHELATNASKYGAWSKPGGKVQIAWRLEGDDLILNWTERGAPAEPPASDGFGTNLIDFIVERAFCGTIARHYRATGFACRITLPIEKITVTHTADEAA